MKIVISILGLVGIILLGYFYFLVRQFFEIASTI